LQREKYKTFHPYRDRPARTKGGEMKIHATANVVPTLSITKSG
jgi:hypothetical protein